MGDNAIEIRGLQKAFPKFQLGPVDISVPKGSIYGLIGPNAAGKTTTIDLILGLGCKDGGSIRAFGLDHIEHEVEVKRRIGYVSPDLSYKPWGRVKRAIHFVRQFYPDWDDEYCSSLMASLGLDWNDKIGSMSYGSKVKLALVIALSHKPDLLLLDEPTLGVDAISKQQIFSELLNAVQNEERTVLISSHGLTDIERFTDQLGFIVKGKMALEGATADLIDRFQMVDFVHSNGAAPPREMGFYVQEHQGDRWRVLIDKQRDAETWLRDKNARDVAASPVTLEELFIGLALGE